MAAVEREEEVEVEAEEAEEAEEEAEEEEERRRQTRARPRPNETAFPTQRPRLCAASAVSFAQPHASSSASLQRLAGPPWRQKAGRGRGAGASK